MHYSDISVNEHWNLVYSQEQGGKKTLDSYAGTNSASDSAKLMQIENLETVLSTSHLMVL